MGREDKNDKKPLLERLTQAYDSLDEISVLISELNSTASSNDDLTPSERAILSALIERAQALSKQCGAHPRETEAPVQQPSGPTIDDPERKEMPEKPTPSGRRKSSKSFDALLLMGIKYSMANGKSASQDRLFELGQSFDSDTKRASLIAKLNRWKNADKWVQWTRPEIITLTSAGEAELKELETIVNTNGDLANIRDTIANVWGFTPQG